jgi:tetratricopeptide (TPR) repeat protein
MRGCPIIRNIALASLLWTAFVQAAFATGAEPAKDVKADPTPCLGAVSAADDDKIFSVCGELLDHDRLAKADRIKALIARGAAFDRKGNIARAIDDYDDALRLDPTLADVFNVRGELYRRKGSRPKALADFGMAIKLNPEHAAAKANYKALALELERIGALMAVAGKPSFDCKTARRAVEKAICANPELADLDRGINAMNVRIIGEARNYDDARALQREQDAFVARRNAEFGRPGFDLRKAMKERMQKLVGVDGY